MPDRRGLAVLTAAAILLGSASPVTPNKPINWDLTTAQITSSCKRQIDRARSELASLAALRGPRTFATVVLPLENLNADLNDSLVAQGFLSQVAPSAAVRQTSLACSRDFASFASEEAANHTVYLELLDASRSKTAVTVYDRALTKLWLQTFEHSGAALSDAKRLRFVALSKQLIDLQNRYNANFSNDETTLSITSEEAAGLTPDFLSSLKRNGSDYVVPVNDSTLSQFMNNAASAEARHRFALAYGNIQVPGNVRLLQREIALRYELAKLMGFHSWAEYQMANRVDRSPAHIRSFLLDLDAHLMPKAEQEIRDLAAFKAQKLGLASATIDPWDVGYYRALLAKERFSVDQSVVRQYFPADRVVRAVMRIYGRMLSLDFQEVTPGNTYYKDVTEFRVTDSKSHELVGSFLLDLFPRLGKPGGAYNAPILPARRLADGTFRAPVAVLQVSDWPAATAEHSALLTHSDVIVFFHEFGHLMASMLAKTPYESLNNFQQDFVEAPSQMLENFVWDRAILKEISSNVGTHEPLPDDLITKMIASRCASDRVCDPYAATRQAFFALVDLDYHTAGPNVDTTTVWADDSRRYIPVGITPGTHPEAQFNYFSSGYDAGVYVYLWSLVYAQDLFTAFKKSGLQNHATGMRYRLTILAPAGGYDANVEVKNFLGRPMSTQAFYQGFGIQK